MTAATGQTSEVVLEPGDDPVPRLTAVDLASVESVSVGVLIERLGRLCDSRMREISAALEVPPTAADPGRTPTMGETGSMLARSIVVVALVGATAFAACGDDDAASETAPTSTTAGVGTSVETSTDEQLFPDIVEVAVTTGGDTFRFDVTVSSPYDTPERYADAWRIVAPDGTVLGVRELAHDHAGEQPFTRSLDGVEIPADVTTVTVEGRDLVSGWGGGTKTVTIER